MDQVDCVVMGAGVVGLAAARALALQLPTMSPICCQPRELCPRTPIRGFAQARDKLSWGCLERLNAFVVKSADALGLVPRWQGQRLVAADASVLMPAIRPCHVYPTFGQCRSAFICAVFTRR